VSDSASLQLTFPFWTMYRATLDIVLRSPVQLVASLVFPAAGVLLIYLWTIHHHHVRPYDILLLIVAFGFTPLTIALSMYLARRKNHLVAGAFMYTFDRSGIHVTGDLASSTINWKAIQKVRESKSFLFLYIAPVKAISIPLAQLSAAGCLDDVRTIVRTNTGQVAWNTAEK
jgi:hypothetical protein